MMVTIWIILGVLILVALIVAVISKSRWVTIATARGEHAEELDRKSAYLKSQNVRNRVDTNQSGAPSGITPGAAFNGGVQKSTVFRLEVKPKDRARAMELLEQFEQERKADEGLSL